MTRNEILDIAHEFYTNGGVCEREIAFARFVMGKEREACAKVCEEEAKKLEGYSEGAYDDRYDWKADGSMDCAAAIRARSNT